MVIVGQVGAEFTQGRVAAHAIELAHSPLADGWVGVAGQGNQAAASVGGFAHPLVIGQGGLYQRQGALRPGHPIQRLEVA